MFNKFIIFPYAVPDQSIPQRTVKFLYVPMDSYFPFCPSSSKWCLAFGLNFLKPIYIYALYRMFHTPRPFNSPLFHQQNIIWRAQHISMLPLCNSLLTSLSPSLLVPNFPKPHSTLNITVRPLNSKHCH